jgi:hypothetical protein
MENVSNLNWFDSRHVRGAVVARWNIADLIEYLHASRHALVKYGRAPA